MSPADRWVSVSLGELIDVTMEIRSASRNLLIPTHMSSGVERVSSDDGRYPISHAICEWMHDDSAVQLLLPDD